MNVGYTRVSKADGKQVLYLQMDEPQQAGVALENVYCEQTSGKQSERPQEAKLQTLPSREW